jgi:hypothetical protein
VMWRPAEARGPLAARSTAARNASTGSLPTDAPGVGSTAPRLLR